METYICKKGDKISQIARDAGCSSAELCRLNFLHGTETLCEGLSLWLPGKPAGRKLELIGCAAQGAPALDIPLSFLISAPCPLAAAEGLRPPRPYADSRAPELLYLCCCDESGNPAPKALHALLAEPEALSDSILRAAEYFDGVFLSLSYLFSFDKEPCARFLTALSEKLHRDGQYLVCALAPKESGQDLSPACAALDYELCARLSDRLVLLCCDYSHSRSAPGAPAPIDAVSRCLDYALSLAPPGKLLLTLSHIGYRWQLPWRQGDQAEPVSNRRAQALALSAGLRIGFDRAARSPFFCYQDILGKRYAVYYEDARSTAEKLELVFRLGLAGIFLRSLRYGAEFLRGYDTEDFI